MRQLGHGTTGTAALALALFSLPAAADGVAGVRLPCEPSVAGTTIDIAKLFGGSYTAYQSPHYVPINFDIGTPRRITAVSFMVAKPASWSTEAMKKSLTYEASLDGVTYETLFVNDSREFTTGGEYMTYAVDDDHHGPYRYFRVFAKSGTSYWGVQLNDIRVVSEELSIEGLEPTVWVDRSAVSMPGTNGVTFSAKVLSATNGSATVYAAYAKKDLGLSLSDWQSWGAVVELGSGAAGETFSALASEIPPGNYFVRYFAVAGGDAYCCPIHYDMTIASSAHLGTMYTLSSTETFKKVYNENVANTDYTTLKEANGHSVVFALDGLAANDVVGCLRVWHNYGYAGNLMGLPVEVSFDDADLDTGSTVAQTVGDRVVKTREAFPDMTWVSVGAFTNAAVTIPYWTNVSEKVVKTAEIALDQSVMRRRPKYLRVTGCTDSDALWPLEFELRSTTLPAAPEGSAKIDEVGSAFARVSGHVDTRGTGGGNATVYLAATPTAGGATVTSAVAADVGTESDFSGTATGLSGSTQYSWQMIASNATAGAVIARGTFTTEESSGSLVPIVSFTGATANADGTVTISYNMSDAGEGYAVADVYVRYGTDPDNLTGEKLIASGALGEGSVAVAGLPPGEDLYLALVAKNAGGKVSEETEQKSCSTVGPAAIGRVLYETADFSINISGMLSPRGVGEAQIYFDYVSAALATTTSVQLAAIESIAVSNFAFTAAMPRVGCVTGSVRVVNSFGGATWTNRSDETVVPLGVRMPLSPTIYESAEQTAPLYTCRTNSAWRSANVPFVFDLGAEIRVSGVAFLVNALNWTAANMLQKLAFEGSTDGATWEKFFVNSSRPFTKGVYMTYPVDSGSGGPYRYIRVGINTSSSNYEGLQLCDMRVLSTELAVEGNRPIYWARDLEAGCTNEVAFTGRLLSAPAGTARVYAAYATKDLGDSLADWRTKAKVVDCGTLSEGASFSNAVAVSSGTYCCRYFAVSGDDGYLSPQHYTFTSASESFVPEKLYISGDAIDGNGVKRIYNGAINDAGWYNATVPQIVLPLDAIPSGYRLASVRVWAQQGYLYDVSADLSYDFADLDSVSTEAQDVNNRKMMAVSAFPEQSWTAAGAFSVMADVIDQMKDTSRIGAEFLVPRTLADAEPKFIRINYNHSILCLQEIELRVVEISRAPEGWAKIDEVGSSFARVSGGIDFAGTGGGDATVYLVATPTAGGAAYSTVIASGVTEGESFSGTAVGLMSDTEYGWRIDVSNATAGATLVSGTFTTEPSSGSPVPVVEMTAATVNGDGTVQIGYVVSDAGEGYVTADVYVRYGTDPDALTGEKLIAEGALGAGSVAVDGLPPGVTLYLALVAKNAGGAASAETEQRSCEMVGPCGLKNVGLKTADTGCGVTITGSFEPRGVGTAEIYFDYVTDVSSVTSTVLAGTVPFSTETNFTVTASLPRHHCVTGAVYVINTYAGVSWTNRAEGAEALSAPLGVRLPLDTAVVGTASDTVPYFNGRYMDARRSASAPYTFDLGALFPISGISFMVNLIYWGSDYMAQNLRFEGSADGTTYETLFVNAGREFVKGGVYMNYVAENGHYGPYRYVRVSIPTYGNNYEGFQLCDMRVLSTALAVRGNRPIYWDFDLEAGCTNEVTFSGTLLSAPSGSAHVYALCSPTDLGNDVAVWQERGTVVDLGVLAEGATFSNAVAVASGSYFCRYCAVSGDDVHFSPELFTFTAESTSYVPSKIYISGDAAANIWPIYDGILDSYVWYSATTPQMVLPLDEIPDGYRLASARVWVRPGYSSGLFDISADVSYDDADLDTGSTVAKDINNRKILGVPTFPSMTWAVAGGFTNMADAIEHSQNTTRYGAEFNISRPLVNARPKFIRFNYVGSTLTFDEIELRVTKIPPEPEGWAVTNEVGSAFVRASGRVYSIGTGGGTADIYFTATPAAGGTTVTSVLAADVDNECDFAGQATGLRSSTQYNWRIIASNETAGAVIASGTFTTEEGSGLVAPTVSFGGATANDDGTVTIAYNVSDAGEGCSTADVYVRYGTSPDDLAGEKLVAEGVIGEGSVAVAGLPPGEDLYLALVAKNESGYTSGQTESRTCTTVGPCGLAKALVSPGDTGCVVTVTGTLDPRGLGDAEVYLDYVSSSLASTTSVLVGTVASGAESNFAFVAAMPRTCCITGSVRVVNSFGGVTWTNRAEAAAVPLGVRMPCDPTVVNSAAHTAKMYTGANTDAWQSEMQPYYFDIGSPRLVHGISFMVNRLNWGYEEMLKSLTVDGSADGETYETIFVNTNRPFTKGVYMNYVAEGGHFGPYRRFRVSVPNGKSYSRFQLCDIRVLTTGLAVEGNRPTYWEHDLAEARTNEVTFSGRLLSAPTGSARVYAVCAKRDLGDSDAAWLAGGLRVDLGEVNEGEEFSAVASVPAGAYVCRYLAEADEDTHLDAERFTFTSDTRSHVPARAFIRGSDVATQLRYAYDGKTSSYCWHSTTEPLVLPLDTLPSSRRLTSVRVWARYGSSLTGVTAEFSFDSADLDTGSTEIQTESNRTVRAVTDYPEMTWTEAGAFSEVADMVEFMQADYPNGVEIMLSRELSARHPKFIRIKQNTDTFSLAEVELRYVPVSGLTVFVR